jgi:hypothetical protein
MGGAALFKIVDSDTGNTVGFYRDEVEARARFQHMVTQGPDGDVLVLVSMAEDGSPLEAQHAEDLIRNLRKRTGGNRKAQVIRGTKASGKTAASGRRAPGTATKSRP